MNSKFTCCVAALAGVASFGCSSSAETPDLEQLASAEEAHRSADGTDYFYVPAPDRGGVRQVADLIRRRKIADAARVAKMITTPQAVWFTDGSPSEVKKAVKQTTKQAKAAHRVPVLVAYNVPYRDCAQYSAGGAVDTAAYQAWIDGFASGIGDREAVVILEPDGLGIIPNNLTFWGAKEWCQPKVIDEEGNSVDAPGATSAERYAQLRYAIQSLAEKAPNASIYLDATHSYWLGVGEAAYRLYKAGFDGSVPQVKGFYVNTSNYQTTATSTQFGTWVSMCLATGMVESIPSWYVESNPDSPNYGSPQFGWCAGQYRETEPGSGVYVVDYSEAYAATVTEGLLGLMSGVGATAATMPFVIDTSRNGQGPLDASAYAGEPYNQPEGVITALNNGNWCNPPGRGVGPRPTNVTGNALVDAYLWVKIPGQSDGSCDSAGGARAWDFAAYNPWGVAEVDQPHFDPLWGMVNPAAGEWFPEQALELAKKADPPLL
jgi:endoglucanase